VGKIKRNIMSSFIPVCEPLLAGNELKYVTEAVQTGWISSSGKYVTEFENQFAKYCDCEYGVRFNENQNVEGYDPDKYLDMYYNSREQLTDEQQEELWDEFSGNWKGNVNAMRRLAYKENREKILAQKKSAYAKRKELNSPKAEEINVD
jgi:hypothetical protein